MLTPSRLFAAAVLTAAAAPAQLITWGPVLPTVNVAEVSTNGTLVVARNLHAAGAAQSPTVNGVPFLGGFAPSGWTNASTSALNGSTTGDAGYDVLLGSARATSAAVTANPTGWGAIELQVLGALTVGRTYEIQCWFTDQRTGTATNVLYDRVMTLSSALGAATLVGGEVSNLGTLAQGPVSGPLDADPDNVPATPGVDQIFGSHCTGTFTWTNASDRLWLLVQGSHPIATNVLRSHLTAFQIRELAGGTWVPNGAGCAGPAGVAALQPVSPPTIGGTFALNVAPVGPGFVFMLTGITALNVPLPLPQFVPGCTALASPDLVDFAPTAGTTAAWSLAIPANPALAGFQLFNQALEFGALWSLSSGGIATLQ